MAEMTKVRRLVNPGKRKNPRKLSALQKLFFGSKRQRAAVSRKRNAGTRSFRKGKKFAKQAFGVTQRKAKRYKRKRNISRILTVLPNPAMGYRGSKGYRKYKAKKSNKGKRIVVINKGVKMATRKRRSSKVRKYARRKRLHNVVYRGRVKRGTYKYSANPGRRRRRRHSNPGLRRKHYRRNPGMLGGTSGQIVGVIGGTAITALLSSFLPATLQSGPLGYLATAAVAVAQGKLIGKVAKNQQLGHNLMVGGLAYVTIKVLKDFFPSIGQYIPGMGLIGGSSFYTPQVNQNGSMGTFVVPSAVTGAMPMVAAASGMGRARRSGRLM